MRPLQDEAMRFNNCAPIFHMIGDCYKAANIISATGRAFTAAKDLGRFGDD